MLNQRVCLPYAKIPQIPAILNSPPGLPSPQVGLARGRPRFAPLTIQRYSALSISLAMELRWRALPAGSAIKEMWPGRDPWSGRFIDGASANYPHHVTYQLQGMSTSLMPVSS